MGNKVSTRPRPHGVLVNAEKAARQCSHMKIYFQDHSRITPNHSGLSNDWLKLSYLIQNYRRDFLNKLTTSYMRWKIKPGIKKSNPLCFPDQVFLSWELGWAAASPHLALCMSFIHNERGRRKVESRKKKYEHIRVSLRAENLSQLFSYKTRKNLKYYCNSVIFTECDIASSILNFYLFYCSDIISS